MSKRRKIKLEWPAETEDGEGSFAVTAATKEEAGVIIAELRKKLDLFQQAYPAPTANKGDEA